jgi:predicted MPP superfamily phosphohydrolase
VETRDALREAAVPKWLQATLFFATVFVVWGGLHTYLYFRVAGAFALDGRGRLVLKLSLVAMALLYPTWRLVDRYVGTTAGLAMLWPANVWMGLAAMAFTGLLAFDLAVSLPLLVLRHTHVVSPVTTATVSRIGLGGVTLAAFGMAAWGMAVALSGPRLTDVEVRLDGLPRALDGFRVVALSDIHAGELVRPSYLDRVAARVEAAEPDLVVLVGDLSDEPLDRMGASCERLGHVKARHGVLAVTGNHEYYRGGERTVAAMEAHGIPVLRQAHRVVADGLVVAGVDDPSYTERGRKDMPGLVDAALRDRPPGLPVMLLSHQPVAAAHAAEAGVGLMVSGHTHGGQIPPFQAVTTLAYGYLTGRYEVGRMVLYVMNGAGFWGPPMRIFADPGIVRFTLRRGGAASG